MTIDNGLLVEGNELDEAVVAAAKKDMVKAAEPLLAAIFSAKGAAERNIAKRQTFVDGSAAMAQAVRDAYAAGDKVALAKVQTDFDKYQTSLLRAKTSRR